jgi:argininosuccinate lyase
LGGLEQVTRQAAEMLRTLTEFVTVIRVDPARTLELVNADYSVMTELADTLLRQAGVPFRTGHEVASQVAAYGRTAGKRPIDLSFEEVDVVYRKVTGQRLPVSPEQLRAALNAESFVRTRQGAGGPQPQEMRRMLEGYRAHIRGSREWLQQQQAQLQSARSELDSAFERL